MKKKALQLNNANIHEKHDASHSPGEAWTNPDGQLHPSTQSRAKTHRSPKGTTPSGAISHMDSSIAACSIPPASSEGSVRPESVFLPESSQLTLPTDYEQRKYPHYSVQSSIYSLLLSALSMAQHYERFPGEELRQELLAKLIREYQRTCDRLKILS